MESNLGILPRLWRSSFIELVWHNNIFTKIYFEEEGARDVFKLGERVSITRVS